MHAVRATVAAAVLAAAACAADSPVGDCPPASDQQQSAGAFILFTTCAGCHSSQLEGPDREGAPVGLDFDKLDVVHAMAGDIYRTARDGTMPPPTSEVPALSDAQVEALRVYLACQPESE